MKRSKRLVSMTRYILENPHTRISLPFFTEMFTSAKSSISEDLAIIDERFREEGTGHLESIAGAAGGVRYIPAYSREYSEPFVHELCGQLSDKERLLPGGYLFMSDLLGDPRSVDKIGKLFAAAFKDKEIDAVMTVATKGIPLAYAAASHLNVPVVIARRDPKVTEGSTVSINYVSGSTRKIQTMVLTKRSLQAGAKVCIIDDFMKAGGTINGMKNLLKEFGAEVAGIGVLAEAEDEDEERVVDDYVSLVQILHADDRTGEIEVQPGNLLDRLQ